MTHYGQFCPVAKAMELLDERWTMLVVRELIMGSRSFGDLQRGVPKMSPTLLSARLKSLGRAGVVERHEQGKRVSYSLTPAGLELKPVVEAIGQWGVRWMPELGDEDLDPHLLMWDVQRSIDLDALPPGRTVVQFSFRDVPRDGRDWWLVMSQDDVDLCDVDPGHPVSGRVDAELRSFSRLWRGDVSWSSVLRSGDVVVEGPRSVQRGLQRWLNLSVFAGVARVG